MTTLYRNTRSLRVRFLQVLFWAAALGFAGQAALSFRAEPASDSWIVGAVLAPLLALFALGMEWYLRCYVTALEARPDGLVLETLSTLGRKRTSVPWADVELAGGIHETSDEDDAPSLDNSAAVLRVRGRALLIVDTTEDAFDSAGLASSLRTAR